MFDSFGLQLLDIWLYIGAFVFHHMDSVSEESLFPGILWVVPDLECMDITTRLDIGSVDLGTGTVVIEISRILRWEELLHGLSVAVLDQKNKYYRLTRQVSRLTMISQVA